MLVLKYWLALLVPLIYSGFYISVIYLSGDIVHHPVQDCQCKKDAFPPHEPEKPKHSTDRLMEEINERNRKYLKDIPIQRIPEELLHTSSGVKEKREQLQDTFPTDTIFATSDEEARNIIFKSAPMIGMDNGRRSSKKNFSNALRRTCLGWALSGGKVKCSQWKHPELFYHVDSSVWHFVKT